MAAAAWRLDLLNPYRVGSRHPATMQTTTEPWCSEPVTRVLLDDRMRFYSPDWSRHDAMAVGSVVGQLEIVGVNAATFHGATGTIEMTGGLGGVSGQGCPGAWG